MFVVLFSTSEIRAQSLEFTKDDFKKLALEVEGRRKTLVPIEEDELITIPDGRIRRQILTYFEEGESFVVLKGGSLFPKNTSLETITAGPITFVEMCNPRYYATVSKATDMESGSGSVGYSLSNVEKREKGSIFPDATIIALAATYVDGKRVDYSDLLDHGAMEVSAEKINGVTVATIKWNGTRFWGSNSDSRPVFMEMKFDADHARCLERIRTYPRVGKPPEVIRDVFEYKNEETTPTSFKTWNTIDGVTSQIERRVLNIRTGVARNERECYLSHYGLPEPPFTKHGNKSNWLWYSAAGILAVFGILVGKFYVSKRDLK